MPCVLEHFDLGGQVCSLERFGQLGLGVRLGCIVVGCDRNQVFTAHLRHHQVQTAGLIGHEPAAVERGAGADALGHGRSGLQRHEPAHAVAERAGARLLVHGRLRIEKRKVGGCVEICWLT